MKDDEKSKRDRAMSAVAGAPQNFYEEISAAAVPYVRALRRGTVIFSDNIYHTVTDADPSIKPNEKRVMGPIMKKLEKLGLIKQHRTYASVRRSHAGLTTEWIRL